MCQTTQQHSKSCEKVSSVHVHVRHIAGFHQRSRNHKIPLNSTCQFLDCTAASPATNLWLSGHTFGKVAVIQKFLYFVWGSHVGRHAKIGNLTK